MLARRRLGRRSPPRTAFYEVHHTTIGGEASASAAAGLGAAADSATLTICDLSGDAKSAGALATPYLSPGSLYLLCVGAHAIPLPRSMGAAATLSSIPTDETYADAICEWLSLIQMGAPTAAVVPVLTHCDLLLPPEAHPSPTALAAAARG